MLYVTSRIDRSDILDEQAYFKWYDEDHIDEIVQTSGMKSAFRYRDVDFERKNNNKEKVYLAFYPMQDLAFTQGEEFRKIRVKSDLLPGSGIIYDLADLDVRYLGLIHKTQPKQKREQAAACLVVFGVEPGAGVSDEDVDRWFRDEVSRSADDNLMLKLTSRSTYQRQRSSKGTSARRCIICRPLEQMPSPGL